MKATNPPVYHITHVDNLKAIMKAERLWCARAIDHNNLVIKDIGYQSIKNRRRTNPIKSFTGLAVWDCVPFYFCPRSVMLYAKIGWQEEIIHMEVDMLTLVNWADAQQKRWLFTGSNAGANNYAEYTDIRELKYLDWAAIHASWQPADYKEYKDWEVFSEVKDYSDMLKHGKQAEFLVEDFVPWELFSKIGVHNEEIYNAVATLVNAQKHKPELAIEKSWYYE